MTYSEARTETENRNVAFVMRMLDEGWGARNGWEDVWRETLAPDFTSYFHAFAPTKGMEEAISFNRELFAGFPNLQMSIEQVIAEDRHVIVRGRLTGRHAGPFLGAPASGAEVDVPDVTMFRLEEGLIAESRYFTDLLTVMTAIGAVPPIQ